MEFDTRYYQLEEIRQIPVQELLMLTRDRRTKILCPIHHEKTPSFVIYPSGSFHCFGCGAHGKGALDFLTSLGSSFHDAYKALTEYI